MRKLIEKVIAEMIDGPQHFVYGCDMKGINKAVKVAGGVTALAHMLGTYRQRVQNWIERGVPADECIAIEKHTGVSRHELREDVFGKAPK